MMWETSRCCQVSCKQQLMANAGNSCFCTLVVSSSELVPVTPGSENSPTFQGKVMPVQCLLCTCFLINIARKSKWYEQCSVKLELEGSGR